MYQCSAYLKKSKIMIFLQNISINTGKYHDRNKELLNMQSIVHILSKNLTFHAAQIDGRIALSAGKIIIE